LGGAATAGAAGAAGSTGSTGSLFAFAEAGSGADALGRPPVPFADPDLPAGLPVGRAGSTGFARPFG